MKRIYLLLFCAGCIFNNVKAQESSDYLAGTVISSTSGWTNAAQNALDGDDATYSYSSSASNAWIGIDLGEKHVITGVEWKSAAAKSNATLLAVFEGANREDFMDAIPIYVVNQSDGSADVNVSRGFRYVRYVSPNNAYCQVAEVRFKGYEGEGSDAVFYQMTNLPTVVVHVENAVEPVDKITELNSYCSVLYGKGTKILSADCTLRLRGNYSRTALPKKPYRVKFLTKQKMPDAPGKAKKWTLVPGHGDKTLMRNILSFDISERMEMPYTPYNRPVDVIVNGEYKGCYQLCDQLTVSKDRVNITEMTAEDVDGEALTGGYFFQVDANSGTDDVRIWSGNINQYLTIKSPDKDMIQNVQKEYLLSRFNDMTAHPNSVYANFSKYLDKDTFLKHFLVNEFIGNTDSYWETYFYKDRGDDLFYTGPVWDCDLTFDNDGRTHAYVNNTASTGWTYQNGGSATGNMKPFVNAIISDADFYQRMREIWAHARALNMQEDKLLAVVDKKEALLEQSQKYNFTRWPILNQRVHENYQALGDYNKEVDVVRQYIPKRLAWFDNKLLTAKSEYTLHLSDACWATVYLPSAFCAPEGLTVYSVVGIDEDGLNLEEVEATEPNKPYLIQGLPGDYTVETYEVPIVDGNANGLMVGTANAKNAPVGSHVLQNINGRVAFYKVESENQKLRANSAYLNCPVNSALAHRKVIDMEVVNGVDKFIAEDNGIVQVYDLSGILLMTMEKSRYTNAAVMNKFGSGLYIIKCGNKSTKLKL